MELKQIEYFCAVARLGSFTKAADECFVSQSAISQQIKALEADFECELVARQGRSFTLTPAGECLARRGKELLDAAYSLRGEVSDIALGRPSRLRVGYLNRYDGWELAGAVGTFVRKHPSVEVEMQAGSHDAIYELMLAGKVDMVFNDKRRQFSDAFVNKLLMSCFDYVEVSEANELSLHDSLTAQDLSGQTCIIVCPRSQFETEQDYYRNVSELRLCLHPGGNAGTGALSGGSQQGSAPLGGAKQHVAQHEGVFAHSAGGPRCVWSFERAGDSRVLCVLAQGQAEPLLRRVRGNAEGHVRGVGLAGKVAGRLWRRAECAWVC